MSAPDAGLELSPEELARALAGPPEERPRLLDVRTPPEHVFVALPGSLLIPLQELAGRAEELRALGEGPWVVYCHHGVRSLHATVYLRSLGLDARSLAGGIERYAREVDPSLPRY